MSSSLTCLVVMFHNGRCRKYIDNYQKESFIMTNYSHKVIPLSLPEKGKHYSVIITKSRHPKTTVLEVINAHDSKDCVVSGVVYMFNLLYKEKDHHHFSVYHDYFYDVMRSNTQGGIPGILRSFSQKQFSLHAKKLSVDIGEKEYLDPVYGASIHLIESIAHKKIDKVLRSAIKVDFHDVMGLSSVGKKNVPTVQDCYEGIKVEDTTIIHTDASYNEYQNTGAISIFNSDDSDLCTTFALEDAGVFDSNTLELLGIYHAAMTASGEKKVVIFSDSKTMISLIGNKEVQERMKKENSWYNGVISSMVDYLSSLDNVEYRWVKGHYNDYHNKVVDLMCRYSRRCVDSGKYDSDYFPISFALSKHGKKCCTSIEGLTNVINVSGVVGNVAELIHNTYLYESVDDYFGEMG